MPVQPTFVVPDQLLRYAAEFGVSRESIEQMLADLFRKALHSKGDASFRNPDGVEEFCGSLRMEELVLARACAAGNEHAWTVFLTRYREKLYGFARQIAKEDAAARELADGIYAELYGITSRPGERVSKLNSYSGRGSLEGWLRTVLAQAWVDRYRRTRREVSLEERIEEGAQFAATAAQVDQKPSGLLVDASQAALGALDPEDRYILAAYYLDQRTLAEIARTLGVHESTISRRVERIVASTRKQILGYLTKAGLSRRQAEEVIDIDVRDLSVDLRRALEARAPQQDLPGPDKKSSATSTQDSRGPTF